jgi:hypothetical protein
MRVALHYIKKIKFAQITNCLVFTQVHNSHSKKENQEYSGFEFA